MPLPFSLLLFIFLSLLAPPSPASAGCPAKCGTVQIPYPFGVGPNCSMDPSLSIVCNKSSNPPKPYLSLSNDNSSKSKMLEIIEINPTQIRVKYPYLLAATCYNNTGVDPRKTTRDGYYSIDLTETQFAMSDQNWLTAVGCDDIVAGFGENNQCFAGGCISYCANNDSGGFGLCPNSENGYSAGNGCCRTPIPKGTMFLAAQLTDLSAKWLRNKYFPCSYAFVEEKPISDRSPFSYPFSDLSSSITSNDDNWAFKSSPPPVVRLDWRVGTKNCSEAQRNSSTYACKKNSYCVNIQGNSDWAQGYLCHCKEGYDGNPYRGCQDIDECADNTTNTCQPSSKCFNTQGSYYCCPEGYTGDGDGRGCIQLAPSKSKTVILKGVGSGLGCLLLALMLFSMYKLYQKRKKKIIKERFFKRNGGLLLQQQVKESSLGKTNVFTAKELEVATDNFNESRIIGRGGQGTVYKGMLSDGKIVAVKRSKLVEEQHLEQFINEVVILSQINHRNIVKLLGFCLETEVPLLVYEFMPNDTLFSLIHDPKNEYPLGPCV